MRRRWVVLAAALVGVTVGWSANNSLGAAMAQGGAPPQKNPIPTSPASIKAGSFVYATNCRPCHGLKGEGDGVAPPPGSKPANLAAGTFKHGSTDPQIFKTIKEGVGPEFFMQAWDGKISDTDIWNTINFIRDLQSKRAAKNAVKKK
jgi:mono/diheme cytochrome c family protein